MRPRLTNMLLFVFFVAALTTGAIAFANGTPDGRWIVAGHGAVGLAVVVLSPWKSAIIHRGLRRRSYRSPASVALLVLVAACVASGVAHAGGARTLPLGLTSMQVHVGTALAAMPLAGWHVVRRPVRPRKTDLSRRAVLRLGTVTAVGAALWWSGEALWRLAALPGARRRFTGSYEFGSNRPRAMPVTQWLADGVPSLSADGWRLTVSDADGRRVLGVDDLEARDEVRAILDCTGGWFSEQDWSGVRLDRLVRPAPGDRSVLVRSVTGYTRRLPTEDLPSLLLATAVGGQPLSAGHGFPARLVAPGRRGFWWVKWVVEVRVDRTPWGAQAPFPLR